MSDKYILNEAGEPVPCEDLFEWAMWYEDSEAARIVDGDYVTIHHGVTIHVSTVFLSLATSSPPLLWETAIFNGELDGYRKRYGSRAEAQAGHREALVRVLHGLERAGLHWVHSNVREHTR